MPFLASALTFDALLAAVPFILLLLVGLTHLAERLAGGSPVDVASILHRFLPPHDADPARDPFALVERVLDGVARNRGELSLYAIPAFIWFSTRLFAGIRVSLNDIFDVSARPARRRNFVTIFLLAKARDTVMVVATVLLFLANTALSVGVAIAYGRFSAYLPGVFAGWLGRTVTELLTFVFSVSLFFTIYMYASTRRLPWKTALLASAFTAFAFEIAKRLYGLYLANFANLQSAGGDANIGALLLFIFWVYYTAIVFLLGGVVAETWELRRMQRQQRAILT